MFDSDRLLEVSKLAEEYAGIHIRNDRAEKPRAREIVALVGDMNILEVMYFASQVTSWVPDNHKSQVLVVLCSRLKGFLEDRAEQNPPEVEDGHRINFATLCRAMDNDDVLLMSSRRQDTGAPVLLVCAVNRNTDDGTVAAVPLAEMVCQNPFETYQEPQ